MPTPDDTQTPETPETPGPTVEELTTDRDRWKALSRQNETNFNATRTELQTLRDGQDQALEAARSEARNAALSEVSEELVTAELRLQASAAGAELPSLEFLDLTRFRGDDSRPNADVIKTFVESLPKQNSGQGFPYLAGAGHNKEGGSEFKSFDPNELADFISGSSFL